MWRRLLTYVGLGPDFKCRPRGAFPHYDVEHLRSNLSLIPEGTEVQITEKLHGANALYTYRKGKLWTAGKVYMRSRTVWKDPAQNDWWQEAYRAAPEIGDFLHDHPGAVLYGEVVGKGVQDLTYNLPGPRFFAFDVWQDGEWWDVDKTFNTLSFWSVPYVPILHVGLFDLEQAKRLALEDSILAGRLGRTQMSEGIVIRSTGPTKLQLKLVSDRYLEKGK